MQIMLFMQFMLHLKDHQSNPTKGRRDFRNSVHQHRAGFGPSGAVISSASTAIPSRGVESRAGKEKETGSARMGVESRISPSPARPVRTQPGLS